MSTSSSFASFSDISPDGKSSVHSADCAPGIKPDGKCPVVLAVDTPGISPDGKYPVASCEDEAFSG